MSIANQKGGVGKTTTTREIAWIASEVNGKKVLIIDIDPQGGSSRWICPDWEERGADREACSDLLLQNKSVEDCITEVRSFPNGGQLDIIISSDSLESRAMKRLQAEEYHELTLQNILHRSGVLFDYDYIIIDCPPNPGFQQIALAASDAVIIPSEANAHSRDGVESIVHAMHAIAVEHKVGPVIVGLVFTRHSNRKAHRVREYAEQCATEMGRGGFVMGPFREDNAIETWERGSTFLTGGLPKALREHVELIVNKILVRLDKCPHQKKKINEIENAERLKKLVANAG